MSVARRGPGTFLEIAVRNDIGQKTVFVSNDLSYMGDIRPTVTLLGAGPSYPAVLWSINFEEVVGSVLMRVRADTSYPVYRVSAPKNAVCAPTTVTTLAGDVVLVEHRAGVFAAEACVDPDNDCVWQFPSTWPLLLVLHGDSMVDVSSRYPEYYRQQAAVYASWGDSIAAGAMAAAQATESTILERCGESVIDSLKALASRARRSGGL